MEREYVILYTHQKQKKAKTWHDGVLKHSGHGTKAVLYDEKGSKLDSIHIRVEDITVGEQLESDRYFILVEEIKGTQTHPHTQEPPKIDSRKTAAVPRCAGLKRKNSGFMPPRMVKQTRQDSPDCLTPSRQWDNGPNQWNPPSQPRRQFEDDRSTVTSKETFSDGTMSRVNTNMINLYSKVRKDDPGSSSPLSSCSSVSSKVLSPWSVYGSNDISPVTRNPPSKPAVHINDISNSFGKKMNSNDWNIESEDPMYCHKSPVCLGKIEAVTEKPVFSDDASLQSEDRQIKEDMKPKRSVIDIMNLLRKKSSREDKRPKISEMTKENVVTNSVEHVSDSKEGSHSITNCHSSSIQNGAQASDTRINNRKETNSTDISERWKENKVDSFSFEEKLSGKEPNHNLYKRENGGQDSVRKSGMQENSVPYETDVEMKSKDDITNNAVENETKEDEMFNSGSFRISFSPLDEVSITDDNISENGENTVHEKEKFDDICRQDDCTDNLKIDTKMYNVNKDILVRTKDHDAKHEVSDGSVHDNKKEVASVNNSRLDDEDEFDLVSMEKKVSSELSIQNENEMFELTECVKNDDQLEWRKQEKTVPPIMDSRIPARTEENSIVSDMETRPKYDVANEEVENVIGNDELLKTGSFCLSFSPLQQTSDSDDNEPDSTANKTDGNERFDENCQQIDIGNELKISSEIDNIDEIVSVGINNAKVPDTDSARSDTHDKNIAEIDTSVFVPYCQSPLVMQNSGSSNNIDNTCSKSQENDSSKSNSTQDSPLHLVDKDMCGKQSKINDETVNSIASKMDRNAENRIETELNRGDEVGLVDVIEKTGKAEERTEGTGQCIVTKDSCDNLMGSDNLLDKLGTHQLIECEKLKEVKVHGDSMAIAEHEANESDQDLLQCEDITCDADHLNSDIHGHAVASNFNQHVSEEWFENIETEAIEVKSSKHTHLPEESVLSRVEDAKENSENYKATQSQDTMEFSGDTLDDEFPAVSESCIFNMKRSGNNIECRSNRVDTHIPSDEYVTYSPSTMLNRISGRKPINKEVSVDHESVYSSKQTYVAFNESSIMPVKSSGAISDWSDERLTETFGTVPDGRLGDIFSKQTNVAFNERSTMPLRSTGQINDCSDKSLAETIGTVHDRRFDGRFSKTGRKMDVRHEDFNMYTGKEFDEPEEYCLTENSQTTLQSSCLDVLPHPSQLFGRRVRNKIRQQNLGEDESSREHAEPLINSRLRMYQISGSVVSRASRDMSDTRESALGNGGQTHVGAEVTDHIDVDIQPPFQQLSDSDINECSSPSFYVDFVNKKPRILEHAGNAMTTSPTRNAPDDCSTNSYREEQHPGINGIDEDELFYSEMYRPRLMYKTDNADSPASCSSRVDMAANQKNCSKPNSTSGAEKRNIGHLNTQIHSPYSSLQMRTHSQMMPNRPLFCLSDNSDQSDSQQSKYDENVNDTSKVNFSNRYKSTQNTCFLPSTMSDSQSSEEYFLPGSRRKMEQQRSDSLQDGMHPPIITAALKSFVDSCQRENSLASEQLPPVCSISSNEKERKGREVVVKGVNAERFNHFERSKWGEFVQELSDDNDFDLSTYTDDTSKKTKDFSVIEKPASSPQNISPKRLHCTQRKVLADGMPILTKRVSSENNKLVNHFEDRNERNFYKPTAENQIENLQSGEINGCHEQIGKGNEKETAVCIDDDSIANTFSSMDSFEETFMLEGFDGENVITDGMKSREKNSQNSIKSEESLVNSPEINQQHEGEMVAPDGEKSSVEIGSVEHVVKSDVETMEGNDKVYEDQIIENKRKDDDVSNTCFSDLQETGSLPDTSITKQRIDDEHVTASDKVVTGTSTGREADEVKDFHVNSEEVKEIVNDATLTSVNKSGASGLMGCDEENKGNNYFSFELCPNESTDSNVIEMAECSSDAVSIVCNKNNEDELDIASPGMREKASSTVSFLAESSKPDSSAEQNYKSNINSKDELDIASPGMRLKASPTVSFSTESSKPDSSAEQNDKSNINSKDELDMASPDMRVKESPIVSFSVENSEIDNTEQNDKRRVTHSLRIGWKPPIKKQNNEIMDSSNSSQPDIASQKVKPTFKCIKLLSKARKNNVESEKCMTDEAKEYREDASRHVGKLKCGTVLPRSQFVRPASVSPHLSGTNSVVGSPQQQKALEVSPRNSQAGGLEDCSEMQQFNNSPRLLNQRNAIHKKLKTSVQKLGCMMRQSQGVSVGLDKTSSQSVPMSKLKTVSGSGLQFPDKCDVEQAPAVMRQVYIPANFLSAAAYKQVLIAAVTEYINCQLFEVARRYHQALSRVDITGYTASARKETRSDPNPPCQCGVPSKQVMVRKEGPNTGRYFYACSADRARQCKWADEKCGRGGSGGAVRRPIKDARSLGDYMKALKIHFYGDCQLVKRSKENIKHYFKAPKWAGRWESMDVPQKKQLYLKLPHRDRSSLYAKDDIWVISHSVNFDWSTTFLARSTFYGPSSACEVEIEPLAGYTPSNWHSEAVCQAVLVGNAASELSYLENIQDHIQFNSPPLVPYLIYRNPESCGPETGQRNFQAPRMNMESLAGGQNVHIHSEQMDELIVEYVEKYSLNRDQAEAIRRVANMFCVEKAGRTDRLLLIHGVFGAGKSFLLAVMVLFLIRVFQLNDAASPTNTPFPWKLLISSTTNVAVDRILQGLLDLGFDEFVRVGSVKKISKPVLPYSVHASGTDNQELKDLQEMLRSGELTSAEKSHVRKSIEKHRQGDNKKKLGRVRVVGATCAACSQACLTNMEFPFVMLDECSQMTEPASLLPVARFSCHRLVLVGDPKQLDPTIQGAEAAHPNGLEQTLFDRLSAMGYIPTILRTQYRCHPKISRISNKLFYGEMLEDGVTMADRPPLLSVLPTVCFLDVERGEECCEMAGSFYNEREALFVVFLLQVLLGTGLQPTQIGVITLYRSQVARIVDLLALQGDLDQEMKGVQVSTVDAFQGGERDVIILSCVRTNACGFIDKDKRTNVALTRARHHLVIVGNRGNLSKNLLWGKVIDHCGEYPEGIQSADEVRHRLELHLESLQLSGTCSGSNKDSQQNSPAVETETKPKRKRRRKKADNQHLKKTTESCVSAVTDKENIGDSMTEAAVCMPHGSSNIENTPTNCDDDKDKSCDIDSVIDSASDSLPLSLSGSVCRALSGGVTQSPSGGMTSYDVPTVSRSNSQNRKRPRFAHRLHSSQFSDDDDKQNPDQLSEDMLLNWSDDDMS